MKTFILLPTGIADVPVAALDGCTPLEAANTPHLDRLAAQSRLGLVRQVPEGKPNSSDVAVLSVLGCDPRRTDATRGGIEAAGMGVELGPEDVAFRMNFVSTFRGHLVDFNAGHIGGVEAHLLVEALQQQLGGALPSGRQSAGAARGLSVEFHAGLGYRNLLVIRGGRRLQVETVPPQEVQGQALADYQPYGPDAPLLRDLIERASAVLAAHDINRVRVDLGENPADRIWPWGRGWRTELEPFELRTGRTLSVVAAVPLVRGLGVMLGAEVPTVIGATGHYDTHWAGKLRCALAALDTHDVVVLHYAAANEACHESDVRRKIGVIEELDRFVVGPLHMALRTRGDCRLLLTTDHMTSAVERERSTSHVPFALWGPGIAPLRATRFTEAIAAQGELNVEAGHTLLEFVLAGALPPSAPAPRTDGADRTDRIDRAQRTDRADRTDEASGKPASGQAGSASGAR